MSSLIQPEIKLVRAFMPDLVTSNFDDDSIKNERASMEPAFSHYKSMGIFLDANSVVSGSIWSKFELIPDFMHVLSPTPVMLHLKFDQDWPTDFRGIKVWKCGRWRMDGRWTIGILQAHLVSLRLRWAKNRKSYPEPNDSKDDLRERLNLLPCAFILKA